jgi:hypothetical protein
MKILYFAYIVYLYVSYDTQNKKTIISLNRIQFLVFAADVDYT